MTELKKDVFYMPAEYAPHCATVMIWCERGGSWNYGAKPALMHCFSDFDIADFHSFPSG